MKLENLVYLTKESNSSHVQAVSIAKFADKAHITVDLVHGTWSFGPTSVWITHKKGPFKIGVGVRPEYPGAYPHNLVGIYDRSKIEHLDNMVSEAYSIGSSSSRGGIDVD